MGVGLGRVRWLLACAKRKLGARNVSHAVAIAWRYGLIDEDAPRRGADEESEAELLRMFRLIDPSFDPDERALEYLARCRSGDIPAPDESWAEVRKRCAAIGTQVRASRP